MIGVGNAVGTMAVLGFLLSLFSLFIIPIINLFTFNISKFILKFNGVKKVIVQIAFYLVNVIVVHLGMIFLMIHFGIKVSFFWLLFMLGLALYFRKYIHLVK